MLPGYKNRSTTKWRPPENIGLIGVFLPPAFVTAVRDISQQQIIAAYERRVEASNHVIEMLTDRIASLETANTVLEQTINRKDEQWQPPAGSYCDMKNGPCIWSYESIGCSVPSTCMCPLVFVRE